MPGQQHMQTLRAALLWRILEPSIAAAYKAGYEDGVQQSPVQVHLKSPDAASGREIVAAIKRYEASNGRTWRV